MTDVRARQAQAQQAQAQQAQAQQAQASVPVSTGSSGSSDSSDGVNSEIGKLRAEKGQYEKLLKDEISKFKNDLIGVCSDYNIDLPPQLTDYKSKIDQRKRSSVRIAGDKFCILNSNGQPLSYEEEIGALQHIKGIKDNIKSIPEGNLLFETHKDKNLYEQILDFAIICHLYRVTVDNFIRLLRIINDIAPGKKLSDYISKFIRISILGRSMADILVQAKGQVENLIPGDRDKYKAMFRDEDLDINEYFSGPVPAVVS